MQRYYAVLHYVGNNFCGSQRQKVGTKTVQSVLEQVLEEFAHTKTPATFAGRTDSGVHSLGMVVHFDIEKKHKRTGIVDDPYPAHVVLKALNSGLHRFAGILVTEVRKVPKSFHARYSACKRTYVYCIRDANFTQPVGSAGESFREDPNGDTRAFWGLHTPGKFRMLSPPFEVYRSWPVDQCLNVEKMQEAASILRGRHDFTSFRAASCSAKSPVRTIFDIQVYVDPHGNDISVLQYVPSRQICIQFSAQAFLYHQIRLMVGTLVEVGKGKLTPDDIVRILEGKNRKLVPPMAPAEGLFYVDTEYPAAAFEPLPNGKFYRHLGNEVYKQGGSADAEGVADDEFEDEEGGDDIDGGADGDRDGEVVVQGNTVVNTIVEPEPDVPPPQKMARTQ
eukprot:ANDGO_03122.mRNA.1 tRNA pseudouridine synthase A